MIYIKLIYERGCGISLSEGLRMWDGVTMCTEGREASSGSECYK